MKKRMAAVGLAAGLAGGGVAGLVFTGNSPIAIAQDGGATSTVPAAGTDGATPAPPAPDAPRPDKGQHLAETLKPLVDDGTITQAQADKVIAALEAAGPKGGGHGGRDGHDGGFGFGRGANLDTVSSALGITSDELKTQLKDGKTIAAIAADKGVDVQKVIDAVTAKLKERLDAEVTSGKLTQAEADQRLVEATAQITKMVNGEMPAFGDRRGGPGGSGGPGRHGKGPGAPAGSDDSSSTTVPN